MNFFDQATADLSSMHNVDEFARFLSINKVGESGATAVACILDEELAPVMSADGVREWDATLYVPAASLPEEPVIDQRFELVGDSLVGGSKSVIVVHTNTIHNERVIRLRWFDS
jgi:hypothetical protein